jgi:hypothetical protein
MSSALEVSEFSTASGTKHFACIDAELAHRAAMRYALDFPDAYIVQVMRLGRNDWGEMVYAVPVYEPAGSAS